MAARARSVAPGWRSVFTDLGSRLRADLPSDLRDGSWRFSGIMAKLSYGNALIHYEIWVRPRQRVVELGLHFEADALTNARLLAAFRARSSEVRRSLGRDARVEEWDRGWARVWEPFSLELPSAELRSRVADRFVDYVRALEPIVRDELPNDVEWRLPTRRKRKAISSRASR